MPIFEYRCSECGHVAEVLEKADAPGEHTCEKCGSTAMQKALSVFSARVTERCPSGGSCSNGSCPLR